MLKSENTAWCNLLPKMQHFDIHIACVHAYFLFNIILDITYISSGPLDYIIIIESRPVLAIPNRKYRYNKEHTSVIILRGSCNTRPVN